MNVEKYDKEYYFDLSDTNLEPLFEDIKYIWEVFPKIKKWIAKNLVSEIKGHVQSNAFIGKDVSIGKGTVVESGSYIKGPAIIGENVVIRHGAYLRENCIIGNNCIVGHASEIKNSIMLNGSAASHFGYVGDTILGNGVNLAAGCKLSNNKNDGEEITVTIDREKYFTGLKHFGAIIGDNTKVGCNAVTNPGTLIGKSCIIYPCSSIKGILEPNTIVKLRQEIEVIKKRENFAKN